MIKNKLRYAMLTILTTALSGILIIFAQNTKNQTVPDSEKLDEITKQEKERFEMFYKKSRTDVTVDTGNAITAIRRIISVFEEADRINKMELIEVELYSEIPVPISDADTDCFYWGEGLHGTSNQWGQA